LKITLGEIRILMRGPMFPNNVVRFADNSIILTASKAEEGGVTTSLRSVDGGNTWKPFKSELTENAGPNAIQLRDGMALTVSIDASPIADKPGWYQTTRWESINNGKTARGPLKDGLLFLPPAKFDGAKVQWFHGNIIEMPNGDLLAAMQGVEKSDQQSYPFRSYLSKSSNRGKTWEYVSLIASLDTVQDPEGLTQKGWVLHGPCEPNMVHLGKGKLVCVIRLVNDDLNPLIGPAQDVYHDLSYTLPGNDIHPSSLKLPADKYYSLGPPTVPLIISYSSDGGETWSRAVPMQQARGCFPRMALSEGILALTYGGLAYPRWGNCISFSLDGGKTWSEEINFGPFFTTGYTDIIETGSGKFLCVFDCTPPQPWTNYAAHWVGAVDIKVEK